jgi:hypothetical protein
LRKCREIRQWNAPTKSSVLLVAEVALIVEPFRAGAALVAIAVGGCIVGRAGRRRRWPVRLRRRRSASVPDAEVKTVSNGAWLGVSWSARLEAVVETFHRTMSLGRFIASEGNNYLQFVTIRPCAGGLSDNSAARPRASRRTAICQSFAVFV